MIYFFVIVFSILCVFIATKIKKKDGVNRFFKVFFYFLAFFAPFLVSGMRAFSIGTDTDKTYYDIYTKVLLGEKGIRDIGYAFINKIAIFFSKDYRSVIFLTSLLVVGFAYYHIFSKSKYPVFSTFLFFATNVFFISMNMIRQSIATMIFIFAIPAIEEKQFFKYLIICIIAFTIHSASILYFPLYFICNKKIDFKKLFVLLPFLLVFGNIICDIIIKIITKVPYFQKYFVWYFTSNYNTGNISFVSLIISILMLIFLCFCYKTEEKSFELNFVIWMQIISFVCLAFSGAIPLMQRTSWLFTFPLFVYLPQCFDYIKNKNTKQIFQVGICMGYGMYMIVTIFLLKYNEVYPYYSMFSNTI